MTRSGVGSDYDCGSGAAKVLLLDYDHQHAERLAECLRSHSLWIDVYADPDAAIARLHRGAPGYEVVIINVSSSSALGRKTLQKLRDACRRVDGCQEPLFLCVSNVHQEPKVVLQIERTGARYVRER